MDLTEAVQLVLSFARPLEGEAVALEAALGRIAHDAVAADRDIPGEDRSRYDGYALSSEDTAPACREHPVVLRLLPGLLAAGHGCDVQVSPGECVSILTGAPLPPGTDAVVPQEAAARRGNGVCILEPSRSGNGVAPRGGDAAEGDVLVRKGEILTPTRLALATALGVTGMSVFRRPHVALLATGDEMREPGQPLDGPGTYCNNRLLLGRLVEIMGGRASHLGTASDDPDAIVRRLGQVDADVVITTGGIGRGARDFILQAWERMGVRACFRSINLSPGRHTGFGMRGGQAFFALPGNPWAAQLLFQELVCPFLRKLQGNEAPAVPVLWAVLEQGLANPHGGYRAVRGRLSQADGWWSFHPAQRGGGSFLKTMGDSFAYTILSPRMVEVRAGSRVQVRLHDMPLISQPPLGWG